jgi:hypothetical protein
MTLKITNNLFIKINLKKRNSCIKIKVRVERLLIFNKAFLFERKVN